MCPPQFCLPRQVGSSWRCVRLHNPVCLGRWGAAEDVSFQNSLHPGSWSCSWSLVPSKFLSHRQVVANERRQLVEQLESCCEAALSLHLAALLLFNAVTGGSLTASGKFVPHILNFLKPHLPQDLHDLLTRYQGYPHRQRARIISCFYQTQRSDEFSYF